MIKARWLPKCYQPFYNQKKCEKHIGEYSERLKSGIIKKTGHMCVQLSNGWPSSF
jgi:hypothetical protein